MQDSWFSAWLIWAFVTRSWVLAKLRLFSPSRVYLYIFFFFLHFSCLQFATMSDSILSRRKLARPQFWYQFSSLISWRWRKRLAYLMPNLLHLLLNIQRRCEACSWTVYSRLVLTVHATCQPFRKMIIKHVWVYAPWWFPIHYLRACFSFWEV